MPAQFRILLVDDDPDIADILNRSARADFPEAIFIYVKSFAEAADYLGDLIGRGPQLVLLDINLQTGLSGFEFLSLIRQHPQGRLVPIIILSSTSNENEIQEAYIRRANAFNQKPFSYTGWKAYVKLLRTYWFETVTVPQLRFNEDQQV